MGFKLSLGAFWALSWKKAKRSRRKLRGCKENIRGIGGGRRRVAGGCVIYAREDALDRNQPPFRSQLLAHRCMRLIAHHASIFLTAAAQTFCLLFSQVQPGQPSHSFGLPEESPCAVYPPFPDVRAAMLAKDTRAVLRGLPQHRCSRPRWTAESCISWWEFSRDRVRPPCLFQGNDKGDMPVFLPGSRALILTSTSVIFETKGKLS